MAVLFFTAFWGYSSVGRALQWHCRGQRFDPACLHHFYPDRLICAFILRLFMQSDQLIILLWMMYVYHLKMDVQHLRGILTLLRILSPQFPHNLH